LDANDAFGKIRYSHRDCRDAKWESLFGQFRGHLTRPPTNWSNTLTLVASVNGPETLWLVADRRLSYENQLPKDDARKIMVLETTDGVAILGYAGLGATAAGVEPADWLSANLRGTNLLLERSLGLIADAMKDQFPAYVLQLPGNGVAGHTFLIPAFLGGEPMLYTIDLVFDPERKNCKFRYTRHVAQHAAPAPPHTWRLAVAGSGGFRLSQERKWRRDLLHLVNAHDKGRITAHAVADYLASLNHEVHLREPTVGPCCIVVWRYKRGGVHKTSSAQQYYTGTNRDLSSPALPTVACGWNVEAFANALMPQVMDMGRALKSGEPVKGLNVTPDIIEQITKPGEKKLR
jgi:hypothetical protein